MFVSMTNFVNFVDVAEEKKEISVGEIQNPSVFNFFDIASYSKLSHAISILAYVRRPFLVFRKKKERKQQLCYLSAEERRFAQKLLTVDTQK